MKVAITGASGFVGLALCQHLKTHNIAFLPLTRKPPQLIAGEVSRTVDDRSGDEECQHALAGCDTLVHLAALTHQPSRSPFDNLSEFRRINVEYSKTLAKASAKVGIRRIVLMSSIKVYGDPKSGPITSNTPTAPNDAYGQTKLEAEQSLQAFCREANIDLVILRPPLIFAPHAKGNLAALVKAVRWRLPLPLASIHNKRDLLSLPNLCDLIRICLSHPEVTNKAWLACDGVAVSTADIVRTLAHAHQLKPRLISLPPSWLDWVARTTGRQQQWHKLAGNLQLDSQYTQDSLEWRPKSAQALYQNQESSIHASP